jgi:hypothetical protein
MLAQMLIELAQVDHWLDESVSAKYKQQPLAQDWARISKVSEELGEAIDEFILTTGQNPRKPASDRMPQVLSEMADVAITAILCIQHFTKSESETGAILVDKVRAIGRRMVIAKREEQIRRMREDAPSMEAQQAFKDSLGI